MGKYQTSFIPFVQRMSEILDPVQWFATSFYRSMKYLAWDQNAGCSSLKNSKHVEIL